MAHLIETMAYFGATPWHGLGNQLAARQPLDDGRTGEQPQASDAPSATESLRNCLRPTAGMFSILASR